MPQYDGESGFLKQLPVLTSVPAKELCVFFVLTADAYRQSMRILIFIDTEQKSVETKGLIDCGAKGDFINWDYVKTHQIPLFPLKTLIKARNCDGIINWQEEITHGTWLKVKVGNETEKIRLLITGLENDHLILRMPWLQKMNPEIDWRKKTVKINPKKIEWKDRYALWKHLEIKKMEMIPVDIRKDDQGRIDPDDKDFEIDPFELWIQAKTNISQW